MYLGVISDTHGILALTEKAIQKFTERNVTHIIHCGDIGNPGVVELFRGIPVDFVWGNCDFARRALAQKIEEIGGTLHEGFGSIELEGKKIAFLHGDQEERLEQEIRSQEWDLICSGHTHCSSFEQRGRTKVLNPGAIQRHYETPSAAVVELPKIDVTPILLN